MNNTVYFTPSPQRANYSRFRDLLLRESGEEFIINEKTLRLEAPLTDAKFLQSGYV